MVRGADSVLSNSSSSALSVNPGTLSVEAIILRRAFSEPVPAMTRTDHFEGYMPVQVEIGGLCTPHPFRLRRVGEGSRSARSCFPRPSPGNSAQHVGISRV